MVEEAINSSPSVKKTTLCRDHPNFFRVVLKKDVHYVGNIYRGDSEMYVKITFHSDEEGEEWFELRVLKPELTLEKRHNEDSWATDPVRDTFVGPLNYYISSILKGEHADEQ